MLAPRCGLRAANGPGCADQRTMLRGAAPDVFEMAGPPRSGIVRRSFRVAEAVDHAWVSSEDNRAVSVWSMRWVVTHTPSRQISNCCGSSSHRTRSRQPPDHGGTPRLSARRPRPRKPWGHLAVLRAPKCRSALGTDRHDVRMSGGVRRTSRGRPERPPIVGIQSWPLAILLPVVGVGFVASPPDGISRWWGVVALIVWCGVVALLRRERRLTKAARRRGYETKRLR
jgi:hypothetical protein